jgi:aspartate carbamoyltransferase catalytic subunit
MKSEQHSTNKKNPLFGRDIVSIEQFDRAAINTILLQCKTLIQSLGKPSLCKTLSGRVIALIFFEPSTRTYNSFSSAAQRIGAGVIGMQDTSLSSMSKGETFEDTVRMYCGYADAIVMRHPEAGSVARAAEVADIPVINAGDGIGEHPTQTLLDLFTIQEKFGTLDNLTGLMAGDLLNGRTVHSLLKALSLYKNNTIYLLSPKKLQLEKKFVEMMVSRGVKLIQIESEKDIPTTCHFWYWTRVQKERFESMTEYKKYKTALVVTPELLKKKGNKNLIIMHPLPRVGEIDEAIDSDPRAYYFKQARNGLFMRMTLLTMILDKN